MKINNEKLKLYQAQECLSNKDLIKKAGISLSTLAMVKAGKRECQGITVGKIAKALGVSVTDLLTD